MSDLLKRLLDLHKKGELTKEVFDALKDDEKENLFKEIDGQQKYDSLSTFMKYLEDKEKMEKDAEEKEDESNDDDDTEKDADEPMKKSGEDTDTDSDDDKGDDTINNESTDNAGDATGDATGDTPEEEKSNTDGKKKDAETDENKTDDVEASKKRAKAEADMYAKALEYRFKEKDYGNPAVHGGNSKYELERVNANLRKAFADGTILRGINLFEKAVDGSKYVTTEIAEKIFEAPEVPTRLIDRFYSKRVTQGDTVRFNELGSPTAAVVTKGGTITYGDGAATTSDTITLKKYTSAFRIAYEDTQDPTVDLQALMTRKAGEAVRDKVEVDAVAAIISNLQATRKVSIEAAKDSGASNNINKITYEDLLGLGSVIDVFGVNTPQFAAHPSIFRYILSRTDTPGQKIFEGMSASADNPGNIEGITTLPTSGLDTYNTIKAASTVKTVLLQSDWENTCGAAFDGDSLRIMATYNPANDSYDVAVFARAVATPVVTSQIAALETKIT